MAHDWACYKTRISQCLHRDPMYVPSLSANLINVELRRRLWTTICLLDNRTSEGQGHETTTREDPYDKLLPINVDDEELGLGPSENVEKFTDITIHLVRFTGMLYHRKVVQETPALERRLQRCARLGIDFEELIESNAFSETMQSIAKEMVKKLQTLI